jgi:uncharacterized protein (DUF58 family)
VLGGFWLVIAVILLIASVVLHQVPLLLISLLFFLAGGVARLWGRYCLSRVEYHRRLSSKCVFFGEEVQLEIEVANRKPLPLPWIQINDEIPGELTLLKGKTVPSYIPAHSLLSILTSLNWYHKVKRRYPLQCRQRGYFTFGPAHIRSGDIFGFFVREKEIEELDHLTVYPMIVPLERLGIPSKQPIGDIRTRSQIFQDPLLTLGVREYQSGDSLKRIHWKTTARLGKLSTKVFESTTTVDMGIFLDVRTVRFPYWGSIPQLLEMAIISAASIANHALSEGYRVGLYVNQNRQSSAELIRIPPSQHPDQLRNILEALAPLQSVDVMPLARLVAHESRNLPWGSTITTITAQPTDALLATLMQMQRVGRRVVLIVVGDGKSTLSHSGLTTYFVRDDVMWEEMDKLTLETR